MKTEGRSADFARWIIELCDGAFQIQREFSFGAERDSVAFLKSVGSFMKSPHMTVSATACPLPKPSVRVTIQILPERNLLKAASEIAAICEHEYSLIQAHPVQSAA